MTKKTRERMYLDAFLKATGWANEAAVVEEGESPDFMVRVGTRVIGVEVTQVFSDQTTGGSGMREEETHHGRWLVELARDYYAEPDATPALVNIQFQPGYFERIRGRVPAEVREQVLRQLRQAAMSGVLLVQQTVEVRDELESLLAMLWVTALPASEAGYSRWRLLNDAIGFVCALSREHVEAIVAKKAARLVDYQRRVQEVVLLLVADSFQVSGMMRYESEPVPGRGFSAVYLLHHPRGALVELATAAMR
jgi:hypothetical protein